MGRRQAQEKQQTYKSNSLYEPEVFCSFFDGWMQARKDGDRRQMDRCINEIYNYLKDYVYHTLWRHFPQQMANEEASEELIQDFWVEVMKALPGYDYRKARITTFLEPYVHSAGRAYYGQLYHTTGYYADIRGALEKAVNNLRLEGEEEPEPGKLASLTGFRKSTVQRVCEEMRVDRHMCSLETGFAEIASILPAQEGIPEKTILQQDLQEKFGHFRKKLSGEEAFVFETMWEMELSGENPSYWKVTIYLKEKAEKDSTIFDEKYSHWKVRGIMRKIGRKLLVDKETRDYSYEYVCRKTG